MRYRLPHTVLSPRQYVSNVKVIFDGGDQSFSIAEIEWEGGPTLAMRWNVGRNEWDDPNKINLSKECLGMPVSRANPVWFVLPEVFRVSLSEVVKNEIKRLNDAGITEIPTVNI